MDFGKWVYGHLSLAYAFGDSVPTKRNVRMRTLIPLLMCNVIAAHCSGGTLYFNNFDDSSALDGFTVGQFGSGSVMLDNGKLRIDPGFGYLNRGFAALSLSTVSGYNSILASNPGMLAWAFNVSSSDGGLNQNNYFKFGIFSSSDYADSTGFGYSLGAGGYVADRMILTREALAASPFGAVSQPIVDIENGLSPSPQVGAMRLTYEPWNGRWNLYFEQHDFPVDPLAITTLVGSGYDTVFASEALPYISFGSENFGHVFVDNLSISFIPEPSSGQIVILGGLLLWCATYRRACAHVRLT
jgi:hypothetical protein